STRIRSTSLTIRSAWPTRSMIESEWDTVPASCVVSTGCILWPPFMASFGRSACCGGGLRQRAVGDRLAQRPRHPARATVAADAGDEHDDIGEELVAAPDALAHRQGGTADGLEHGVDGQRVFEPGGNEEIDGAAPYGKADTGLLAQPAMTKAEVAQHLGA